LPSSPDFNGDKIGKIKNSFKKKLIHFLLN
jgi:hypothetical protein